MNSRILMNGNITVLKSHGGKEIFVDDIALTRHFTRLRLPRILAVKLHVSVFFDSNG